MIPQESSASGDITGTSRGGYDCWIVKLNSSGSITWQKNYGGYSNDVAASVLQTSDGGYIVAGYTQSGGSGDVTGSAHGAYDYWVVKLNSSGGITWQKNYGGSGEDYAESIRQTADGGFIVAGYTYSSANGDVTGTSHGSLDYWVVRLDSSGDIVWQKNYGGSDSDKCHSVQVTADGGFLVAGHSGSSQSGDFTGVSKGGIDYWILNLDSTGNIIWQRNYGGSGDDYARSALVTADGGFAVAGFTDSSASGDMSCASKGSNDFWIIKCDSMANIR